MSDKDDLAALATKYGTDKWNSHWYAGPYAEHLGYLRSRSFSMLEIGIGGGEDTRVGGHSLRTWKEFFPHASIHGLDYYDKSSLAEDRINIYHGSQADPVVIARIIQENAAGFEVIIDDGSHRSEHVVPTLMMLWPLVRDGGWYIIEDVQTSYWPTYGGRLFDMNSPLSIMGYLKSLVDGLNWQEMHQPTYSPSLFDKTITGIHFYHNMCFLRKGTNEEGSNEVKHNRIGGV